MSRQQYHARYYVQHSRRLKAAAQARRKNNPPEYKIWEEMKARCYNPNHKRFADYGGRGITVCARWRKSFEAFLSDMGSRPSPKLTLERKKNNQEYCPRNCVWATRAAQMRNTRSTHFIEFKGRRQCLTDWASEIGTTRNTIYRRLHKNWPIDQVLP